MLRISLSPCCTNPQQVENTPRNVHTHLIDSQYTQCQALRVSIGPWPLDKLQMVYLSGCLPGSISSPTVTCVCSKPSFRIPPFHQLARLQKQANTPCSTKDTQFLQSDPSSMQPQAKKEHCQLPIIVDTKGRGL